MSHRNGALLVVLLALSGCGQSGKDDGDDPATPPSTGGTIDPTERAVTGAFFVGDGDHPATGNDGYEVWVADQTAGRTVRTRLGAAGDFAIALTAFTEGHVYALHLIRDHVLVGSVDLSPADGTQAAFYYGGGFGFDVGEVIVSVDVYGRVVMDGQALTGSLGGGFALQDEESGAFNDFPLPEGVALASLGSQLIITDATMALHSFYQAETNPSLYARDLAASSRIGALLTLDDPDYWARSFVLAAGPWLRTSRTPTADDMPAAASPFWSTTAYDLPKTDDGTFEFSVYPGAVPKLGTVVMMQLQPTEASPTSGASMSSQVSVQRALDVVIGHPPAVVAAASDGAATVVIDYASTTEPNGLTRPHCQSGAVTLELAPPANLAGEALIGDFDRIDAEIDYYGVAGGKTAALPVAAKDFPAPYGEEYQSSVLGLEAVWTPSERRLRFLLAEADQAATTHEIQVPDALFPAKLGKGAVARVRLRLYYRSSTSASEAATIFWLDRDC